MARGTKYTEISRAAVKKTRNIVISDCSVGGFTIAQQAVVKEGDMETPIFMRGAFHVENLEGLYNLRDALNLAISIVEARDTEGVEDEDDWDEA